MLKYILFDFDGTLVDTNDLIVLSLRTAAQKYLSRDLTTDDLNRILGKYLDDQMKQLSPDHYKDMVLFYKEFYKAHQDAMTKEFPGIREALRKIHSLRCKTAIVSAKGRGGIEHGLQRFGLSEYIDVIISAYDIQNNKPHPEPAIKALQALEGVPSEALLVGDSPYDILCGKNAGIKAAAVDWTIFPKNSLLELHPDFYVKTAAELVEIIQRG